LITAYSQPKSRKTARSHAKAEEVPAWSRWWFLAILFLYLIQPLCSLCPLWLDSETENLTSVHDADGNTTTRSYSASGRAQTLIWDGLGRLIKVAERNGSNDGYDWSAKYDGANRRLVTSYQKITANLPSPNSQLLTTQSFFDPQVEFLEIGLTTEDTESTETFWKVYGPDLNESFGGLQGIGGLEAVYSGNGTTGIISDIFGHAIARSEDGLSLIWSDSSISGYGPLPGSCASSIRQSGDLSISVSWQGRYVDPTGYFCVGARYYEPISGRFISADPLGHETSMDLYSYANGDPINMADPDGRFASGIYNGVSSNGNIGSSAPSSNSYYTGNIIGAAFSGYAQGLGQGAQNVSGYTRYQEHLTMSDGDVYNAANAAWNPAYLAATGFYQAGTGTGLAPSNIGTQLDWVDRSIAGAEGVLGTVGTVGLATGLTQTGSAARGIANPVPGELARVIPGRGPYPTLGPPSRADVFVTAADDIAGLTPVQISQRLTIPASDTFTIIRFPTPSTGIASPVFRPDPGFIGGGRTLGGAREFVLPNGPIPSGATSTILGP